MAAYVLAVMMFIGGIVGMTDPSSTTHYQAQLLECYDKYDSHGDLNYMCDYRALDTGEVIEIKYKRQVWRGLHDRVGVVFEMQRNNGFHLLYFFCMIIGVVVFIVNWVRRS